MFHLPGICLFSARLIMSHAMHLQGAQGPGPRDDFLCLSPSSLFRQAANASHEADLMLLQWFNKALLIGKRLLVLSVEARQKADPATEKESSTFTGVPPLRKHLVK